MLSALLGWILSSKILSTIRIYDSLKNNHPNQISLPITIGFHM
nr:MAG TPA_asm: hypothetical protein [Caudoviricetes sp.]